MEKLDEVIAGLEACWKKTICGECPYRERGWDCEQKMIDDAIALLKEYRNCLTGCGPRQYTDAHMDEEVADASNQ